MQTSSSLWLPVDGKRYQRYSKPIEKPLVDERQYELIKLQNELQVLLVSDPTLDLAAVALDVGVGHMSDPDDMPGLAHFCEHLSFMGTKKFPVENEYKKFIKIHGGATNASTGTHRTTYHFKVQSNFLPGALERFSGFFHSPLFKQECVEREVNAVHSENAKNQQSDSRRLYQLWKHLSDQNHPWNKFGCGHKGTLLKEETEEGRQETRRRVVEWWEQMYCATRMKVAIVGADSLEMLADLARSNFSEIPNKNLGPCIPTASSPWSTDHPLSVTFVRTVKDTQRLELKFPIPYQATLYRTNPLRYVSHLLGHEGPGSVLYWLNQRGLATALNCGLHAAGKRISLFDIGIVLTKAGLRNYKKVLSVLFHYISLLPTALDELYHFEETKKMAEIDFNYSGKESADTYAKHLSQSMNDEYDRDHIISHGVSSWKLNKQDVKDVIECLDRTKARIFVATRDFEGLEIEDNWEKETWYGTDYAQNQLDLNHISTLSKEEASLLFLPERNFFLPSSLFVRRRDVEKPLTRPRLLKTTPVSNLWYKKDDQYWLPRGSITILINTPLLSSSVSQVVRTRLYLELVKDALNGPMYAAGLAGISYAIGFSTGRITFQVSGYNDKLMEAMKLVLLHVCVLEVAEDRFAIVLEKTKRAYENAYLRQSSEMADVFLGDCTQDLLYAPPDKHREIDIATSEDIRQHMKKLFESTHMTVLVHGNVSEEATSWMDSIENAFFSRPISISDRYSPRSLLLPSAANFVLKLPVPNVNETNSAISYFCRMGDITDRKARAFASLLASMINEPFFHAIRTREQLGYSVSCIYWTDAGTIGLRFRVQGFKHPEFLESRIDAFIDSYLETLLDMTVERFDQYKHGAIAKKREKLTNLSEERSRFWTHISNGYFDFERTEIDAQQIESIELVSLVRFYRLYIHPSSPLRSKLSIRLTSRALEPEGGGVSSSIVQGVPYENFEDVQELRSRLRLSATAMPTIDARTSSHSN